VTSTGDFGNGDGGPAGEGGPQRIRFDPPYRGRGQETLPSWQIDLRQQISRLRTSVTATRYEGDDRVVAAGIDGRLQVAENQLGELSGQSWLRRHFLADGVYEQVLASVMAASEDLLLIQDESAVRARMPAMRAALKAFIDVDDPRFDDYLRVIDGVVAGAPPGNGGTTGPRPYPQEPPPHGDPDA
jgi:hypothetical protein